VCFILSPVQTKTDEAHPQTAEGLHHVWRGVTDWLARVRIDDIGDDPLKGRLVHSLDQLIVAEVELVVAQRREIETSGVQRGDHVLASENTRCHRRCEEVARDDQKRRASRLRELLLQRRDSRQAAQAVDRHRGVDVVDLKKGDGRGRARGKILLRDDVNERFRAKRGDEERSDDRRCDERTTNDGIANDEPSTDERRTTQCRTP